MSQVKSENTARMLNACAFALRARAEMLAVGHVNMAGLVGEMAVAAWELVGKEPQYAPETERLHGEMALYYKMRAAAHEAMTGRDVWLMELNKAVQELAGRLEEEESELGTMELIEPELGTTQTTMTTAGQGSINLYNPPEGSVEAIDFGSWEGSIVTPANEEDFK